MRKAWLLAPALAAGGAAAYITRPRGSNLMYVALGIHLATHYGGRRWYLRPFGWVIAPLLTLYFWRTVRLPDEPVWKDGTLRNFRLRLNITDFVDYVLWRYPGTYDNRELDYMVQELHPGDTLVDVGAHIGVYALIGSRAVGPEGRVVAFEADPETYERLQGHLNANGVGNVMALNVGVSDVEGSFRLARLKPPFRAASSFLHESDEGVDVQCRPLLDALYDRGVRRVDAMKLDIEGMEYRVLTRYFADAPPEMLPRFIIIEYELGSTKRAGGNSLRVLREHGYVQHMRHLVNYIYVRN